MKAGADRFIVALIVLLLAVNVALHTWLGGWTPWRVDRREPRLAAYGLVGGAKDNLAYASFAQQTRHGQFPTANLNTTTPHQALMINPFFAIVGLASAAAACSPVLLFNLLALACIPVCVLAVTRTAAEMGLAGGARVATVCLALGGGGIGWLLSLVETTTLGRTLGISAAQAPDLSLQTLYPAVVFNIFPYHTAALALLAVLVALLARCEKPDQPLTRRRALALLTLSLFLTMVRPYEPLMLLAAYVALTAATWILGPAPLRPRRMRLLLLLAIGIAPGSAYNLWVAFQPGWREFAEGASNFGAGANWVAAFFLCWALAIVGCVAARAQLLGPGTGLCLTWSLLVALLLIPLGSGLSKLCGGCTIPLALLGGIGAQALLTRARRKTARAAVVAAIALLSFASPVLAHLPFLKWPVRAPVDFFPAAERLRADSRKTIPTVLTDWETGALLPGLAACRVYCGHPGLTERCEEKQFLLQLLGFSRGIVIPQTETEMRAVEDSGEALYAQLGGHTFDYVMVRKGHRLYKETHTLLTPVYDGPMYFVARYTPELGRLLQDRF